MISLLLLVVGLSDPPRASAETTVNLGDAANFSVLGGQTVTNTGDSVLDDDVGVSPGTAITGFPPGITLGDQHAADAEAAAGQADLLIAYNDAAGRSSIETISEDLAGRTLTTGVYTSATGLGLSGELTLDAQGDTNAAFIFQAGSTLTTASGSTVTLINGAQACNVFWQVGSSATLGTDSFFVGNVLALTSITVTTGTTVEGRALARNGQVSLDTNVFRAPGCDVVPTTTTTTTVPATTTTDAVPTTTDAGATTTNRGAAVTSTTRSPRTGFAYGSGSGSDYRPPRNLADTGANPILGPLVSVGALLLFLGGLLLVIARGRRASRRFPGRE